MKKYFKIVFCAFLFITTIDVNATETSAELETKLNAVANLLNRSTISKQVLDSHNDAAVQYYRFSKSLYDEAVEKYNDGDLGKSSELIKKSRSALIDAVEFANLKGAKTKKRSKNHYESLRKSANALMEAMDRISSEKGKHDDFGILFKGLNGKLSETDKLYFQGQYEPAIEGLGKVLQTIKFEISQMRSGDTLTRSLHFASSREEYLYEIDRNDTHMMLLDMYLTENDRKASASMSDAIKLAKELRKEAESLASSHKHKEAIAVLEKSTIEIINVIRSTGAFIP